MRFNYRVSPVNQSSLTGYKGEIGSGAGCFLACLGIFGSIGGCSVVLANTKNFGAGFVTFLAVVGVSVLLSRIFQDSADEELRTKEASKQAERLSDELNNNLQTSLKIVKHELPLSVKEASENFNQAKIEYNENAFGPFWDCLEEAAKKLSSFNYGIYTLSRNAETYYRSLENREHNFPVFYPAHENLPDPKPILTELRMLMRKGQTSPHFAYIWEQRQTRKVLIAGFETLGEALSSMASRVENTMCELTNSISSNTSKLIEEQIRNRESFESHSNYQEDLMRKQDRKLDNIQNKRTPRLFE